ncbi:DNA polymerase III subunit gamma/tau [Candidatus Manganitrophus noduliformans]|uniref:DNA polymerase III subunit gamma/tau n=1 Tax=Candidatus Manganitrophus noduliformans TaxID=2606439 RepID=A0A7X6IA31_9BACT|nr:DNA polymerase III subunit gamma/tau [Candidatus Manganitrophus noduliformans]NKE69939.1 DNA polymerase III subunit gamma/tau [Candidatus Manganitrophus noduliformans]
MASDYQVSARKWRPQTFEEVIGQRHVATTLINAVSRGKVAQAYLFSGIRGVGKTTMARLLAKALNCATPQGASPCNQCDSCREITEGRSVDVVEIDGASNTGVDDVRELREKVKYLPLRGKLKIYIIDEVHMLSNAAFNALLKTLEEPPLHLVFIFATTESHKIPATILSRCQHFVFRRISRQEIIAQLQRVADERKVRFAERGLVLIAKAAEGSMRDALSLLDQAISYGGQEVSEEDLFTLLGRMGEARFHSLVRAIHDRNASAALGLAREIADQGYDLRQFLADWLEHLRHLIVARNVEGAEAWIDLPKEEIDEIRAEAALFTDEELQRLFSLFARLQGEIRTAPHPHLLFEVALMKGISLAHLQPVEKILERLETLGGGGSPAPPVNVVPSKVPEKGAPASPSIQRAQEVPRPASSPTPSDKKKVWLQVISEIKEKRPSLGSFLEQGTLLEITEQRVKIGYSESFLIPLIQKEENQKLMSALFKTHFQREMALELVDLHGAAVSSPPSGKDTTQHLPTPHPFVQEALRVLGGEVIETKQGKIF